ncbi:HNH endonuclease [Polaromonas sp.]|uniref:HNH endonuclease n=1 Tax=Polaromonas sp. TaxID=1869339 RepID=UPI0037502AFF
MKALTKSERLSVFNKFGGRCAYCGCELPARWHADHLLPVEREFIVRDNRLVASGNALRPENHCIDNMMPACPPCNISKHSLSLDGWRKWLEGHVRSLNAHNTPYRLAKAYGLLVETGKAVTFYFETLAAPTGQDQGAET